jgi:hypothetical protein
MVVALFPDSLARAQLRTIPDAAKSGKIQHLQDMYVVIDGARKRLAPGAQIRDANNRLVLPVSIPAGARAKYLTDAEGMVRQVWLLSPKEASESAGGKAQ